MRWTQILAIFPLAALLAAPANAEGRLGTLERGHYWCELPGDAQQRATIRVPDADFAITNASSYETPQGRGTYLKLGESIQFTSGPMKGWKMQQMSARFLRKMDDDGTLGRLRCVLSQRDRL